MHWRFFSMYTLATAGAARALRFATGGLVRTLSGASMTLQGPIVSCKEAQAVPGIKCVDVSWHLGGKRDAKAEFLEQHLPAAVFFDIDDIADKGSPLPHMIPSGQVFSQRVSDLGIGSDDTVLVYTTRDCFSAARGWWTFKTFGHDNVYILDGGLPAWEAAGGPLESGEVPVESTRPSPGLVQKGGNTWMLGSKGFWAKLRPEYIRTWRQVLAQSQTGNGQVVDARSLARFNAQAPEPRPGVAGGHIPGSVSVPFEKVLAEGDWTRFRSPREIRQVFADAGVDVESAEPLTTSCGSGVTAAVLTLALEIIGRKAGSSPVYDGAWAEWGSRDDLPREP